MNLNDKILEIRQVIENAKSPVMFFDSDADGATSYLQLKKKFPKISGFPMNKDFEKQKVLLENHVNSETDLVLVFDIPVLTDDFLEGIGIDKKIVWVDHHPTNSKEQIKKYNILHLNPLDFDENDNRSACYFAYLISDLKENLWLCVLGSVSDFFLLDVILEFFEYNENEFNVLFKLDCDKRCELFDFLRNYSFNDLSVKTERENWIRYLTYEAGVISFKNLFDFVYKLDEKDDVLKAFSMFEKMSVLDIKSEINGGKGFLFEDFSNLMAKYKKILKKAIEKGIVSENMFFFEYSAKISFTKTLSEELCYKFGDKKVVAVLFKKIGKTLYNGSFRGNDFEVNDLVVRALDGLDGNGGGHPFAAGLSVDKKDYDVFKKRVFEIVENC